MNPRFHPGRWILLLTLLGFGLRLHNLSFQPLWGDEGWSFYFAAQTLPQLIELTAIDIHPPFYYILLKSWLTLAGFGPETARFFSVGVGTLLIPAVGLLGWRLRDRRVGVTAAGVVALAPLAIYYSQEVRMYGLVTLLGALSSYFWLKRQSTPYNDIFGGDGEIRGFFPLFFIPQSPNPRQNFSGRTYWTPAYILTTTAALYTMYYAAFIFLAQILYSVINLVRDLPRSDDKGVKNYSFSLLNKLAVDRLWPALIITLLYLPWLLYAGPRLVNYIQNKRSVEGYLSLNFIRFMGDHLAAFSLGHLSDALRPYLWAALLLVLLAVIGLIISRRGSLYPYLYLFTPLLLGYGVNLIFPFSPPYFERTLLLAAPAYWLFSAAGLAWLWQRQRWVAGTVTLVFLLVTALSLFSFYRLPRYPDEDYRPLLKDIAARATPADTLLASYQWQLGYYYAYLPDPHPRFFAVPGWGEGWAGEAGQSRRRQDLGDILADSPRLWFPAHQTLGHVWEDEAETTIADLGYPALLVWYSPQTKLTLAGAARRPQLDAPVANFANRLSLLGASLGSGSYEAGRDIVPVDLTWRKETNLDSPYRVSLRLADAAGRTWATRDSAPRAGQVDFADLAVGDPLADRHGLLVPAGAPPGSYRLWLSLRQIETDRPLDLLDAAGQPAGAELLLGEVVVVDPSPPVRPAALPVQVNLNADFGASARLVGYSLGDGPFKAGEILPLTLFWESLADAPGPLTTQIQLLDSAGQTALIYERTPLRPTDQWQHGTLLRDPYDIPLPPTLPPGQYRLVAALAGPDGASLPVGGNQQLPLTTITTVDRPHSFDPPKPQTPLTVDFSGQVNLVGLDLPQTPLKAGQTLPLTLYWQAQRTPDRSWKVFVHLLNPAGSRVSQQDQIPGAGQFPTTGWLPGEYLTDTYTLPLPADLPPGKYRLEIGLYDPNDLTRLPMVEAGQIVNDHFALESGSVIVEK